MEQKITRNSEQSKEFTDALNFVLNYRENMEGMHGFIPSSDLAEMLVIYNQSQPLPNTVNEELAVTLILDIQDYLYAYMHNNKIEALRKKHLTDAAKYVYNRIEKSFSHPVKEANTVPQDDGWVRVEDDLPELHQSCLVYYSSNFSSPHVRTATYLGNNYFSTSGIQDNKPIVTHWRNLPPPPVQ